MMRMSDAAAHYFVITPLFAERSAMLLRVVIIVVKIRVAAMRYALC